MDDGYLSVRRSPTDLKGGPVGESMASGKRDYYEVLGVEKDVDAATIKKAYRKLAIKFHPDRNQGDASAEEKFKEVSEAYAVLSDDEKRQRYDRHGHAGIDQQYSTEDIFRNVNFNDVFGGGGGFGSIFDMFFGGSRGGHGPSRGRDLQLRHDITLQQAFDGTVAEVAYARLEDCSKCGGDGAQPGTKVDTCHVCRGQGQVQHQQRTPFGVISQVGACPECGGAGKRITTPCTTCRGSGHERHQKKERVKVPAGIADGMRIRVSGGGEVGGRGGAHGDLYIEIHVKQHERFHREGSDLITEESVTFPQAALGTTLKLKTLDGTVDVEVPTGTESGDVLRIRGRGMPYLRGSGRGDILVQVRVATPKKLSGRARELMEELADELGSEVHEKKGFFDRLRQ